MNILLYMLFFLRYHRYHTSFPYLHERVVLQLTREPYFVSIFLYIYSKCSTKRVWRKSCECIISVLWKLFCRDDDENLYCNQIIYKRKVKWCIKGTFHRSQVKEHVNAFEIFTSIFLVSFDIKCLSYIWNNCYFM